MSKSEVVSVSEQVHWVGVDVAKRTFDAALVRDGRKWSFTPLSVVPVRSFARTREGVGELLSWLDCLTAGDERPVMMRAVMEATGRYSIELTLWMAELQPSLAPSCANCSYSCVQYSSVENHTAPCGKLNKNAPWSWRKKLDFATHYLRCIKQARTCAHSKALPRNAFGVWEGAGMRSLQGTGMNDLRYIGIAYALAKPEE